MALAFGCCVPARPESVMTGQTAAPRPTKAAVETIIHTGIETAVEDSPGASTETLLHVDAA